MKVNLEKIENNVATLKIEVNEEEFEKALEKSFKKNAKRFNVPGFRRGKAPRSIVERYYGPEVLYEDAAEFALSEAYKIGIEENKLEPVDHPDFQIEQIEKNKPLIATAKVTLKPDVEIDGYKEIEAEKIVYNVKEEDVERELKELQEKNARFINVERPLKEGDLAVIDFEGFINGEPFEGGNAQNYPLTIGSRTFIPGFEDKLIGMMPQETREITVTFPENYHREDLKGKEATFKVTLKEIKEKELIPLDDEFAKDVSEFETLEELKKDLKNKLEERAKEFEESSLKGSILKKLLEKAKVEIPQVMIEREIERLIYDFAVSLRLRGIDLKDYLEAVKLTPEEFKNKFQDRAIENIKTSLVLEKIAKLENISVSEEELDQELQKYAEKANKSLAEYKKTLKEENIEYIKDRILTDKIFKFLIDNAKVTEKIADSIYKEGEEKTE